MIKACVVPDEQEWPNMWRVQWPDGIALRSGQHIEDQRRLRSLQ